MIAADTIRGLHFYRVRLRNTWERAGRLRARVLVKRRRARLGDALIAQSCLDRGVSLLTRDRDFQSFVDGAGLDLVVAGN